jgi:Arc/MetJ-type ribon-helix-helix transcriptional regulator
MDSKPVGGGRYAKRQDVLKAIARRALEREDRAKLRATEQERKEACARIRRAEKEGCLVCLADSLKAGNCRGGSESWARRHGIDPMAHTLPSVLLAKANGEYRRVSLVVTVALRRHEREMRQGYADLSEHYV